MSRSISLLWPFWFLREFNFSCKSENDVNTRVSLDRSTHLANLERKRSILEWFLHLAAAEHAQVTVLLSRTALAVLQCQSVEVLHSCNLLANAVDVRQSFLW